MANDTDIFGDVDLKAKSDKDIFADLPAKAPAPVATAPKVVEKPSMSTAGQVSSWGNRAIAGIGDSFLNAPTNVLNLLKAGAGTVATMAGKGEYAPEVTPPPNYIANLLKQGGLISDADAPQSVPGHLARAGVQGLVGGAIAPAQTVQQLLLNSGVAGAANMVGSGVEQATGSPALGMSAGMLAIPAASAGLNAAREASLAARDRNAVRDTTITQGREAGYVLPPSSVSDSWINRRLESIAGKAAIGQEAAARNQEITNRIGREAAGLPANTAISEGALAGRRNQLAGPYREARAIDPAVNQMIDDLQNVRADARDYWRAYQGPNGRPQDRRDATAADNRVGAIEAQIEAAARNSGVPGLVDRIRAARRDIARVHDVERGLNVGTGDVSAPVLGRALDRGSPLSGDLRTAGAMQQAFPRAMREGATVPEAGVSKSEWLAALGLGTGGFAAAGPYGAMLGALPFLSGPVRAGLLSGPFQNMLAPSYRASHLPALSDPYLRGILQSGMNGALATQ
jgi:hypothetical protein